METLLEAIRLNFNKMVICIWLTGNLLWLIIVHGLAQLTGICWVDIESTLRPFGIISWQELNDRIGEQPDRRNLFDIISG